MIVIGTIFAGLGLFFIGVKLISANLREMTGGKFRRWLSRATANPATASGLGVIGGALTQSSNAMTFVVVSMVTSGMIELGRGLLVTIWANVGTCALVFLATLDVHTGILFLLGFTGLGYYFNLDRSQRYRHLMGALLGFGMLFYGLFLIRSGAEPLKSFDWVLSLLQMASKSHLIAFGIGVVLALVVQSSATVSAVAVTLVGAGLLNFEQTAMLTFGASLGSGLSVLILSSNLSGTGKQIAIAQTVLKVVGVALAVPVFLALEAGWLPAVVDLLQGFSASVDLQIALIYFALQIGSATVMCLGFRPTLRLLRKLSPPSKQERLSSPAFLFPRALDDPLSALELVEREQSRIASRLPYLLDPLRDDEEPLEDEEGQAVEPHLLREASLSVAKATDAFLAELTGRTRDHDALEAIVNLRDRNELTINLFDSCLELVDALGPDTSDATLARTRRHLAEGLHALLATLATLLKDRDPEDVPLLLELSGDRSGLMKRIRSEILGGEGSVGADSRDRLLTATSLVERIAWLVRRYATLLSEESSASDKVTSP